MSRKGLLFTVPGLLVSLIGAAHHPAASAWSGGNTPSIEQPAPPSPTGGRAVSGYGGTELTPPDLTGLRRSDRAFAFPEVETSLERTDLHFVGPSVAAPRVKDSRLTGAEADADLARTPTPVMSWLATGGLSALSGFPADAQIAVSTTHVVVTARSVIGFYNKTGDLLQSPISTAAFFERLNLERDFGINSYFDTRALFDSFRKRFWVAALANNSNDAAVRTKFAVGVSRTESPLDGWYLYWWDAVADAVYEPGDSADYPILGIDRCCFYQTNSVRNRLNGRSYWRVLFRPADQMADGVPGSSLGGWEYWDLTNPDGSPAGLVQPAVHHDSSPRAYLASRFGSDQILIWAITNPLRSAQQLGRTAVTVSPFMAPRAAPQAGSLKSIETRNLGNDVVKAVYRKNLLYLTMNDARDWDNRGEVLTSIRVVRLNVKHYPSIPTVPAAGFIDRVFGARSADDPPGDYFHYAWPAVEVNRNGDMVIVYARSGATIYPEVRFSTFYHRDLDISPSRLLKAGEQPYAITYTGYDPAAWPWGDTAGASVDPADDTTVWIAQQYSTTRTYSTSNNGNFDVWVGSVDLHRSR